MGAPLVVGRDQLQRVCDMIVLYLDVAGDGRQSVALGLGARDLDPARGRAQRVRDRIGAKKVRVYAFVRFIIYPYKLYIYFSNCSASFRNTLSQPFEVDISCIGPVGSN